MINKEPISISEIDLSILSPISVIDFLPRLNALLDPIGILIKS